MSKTMTTINNNNSRASSAAGLSFENGCVTTRVPANMPLNGGGKFTLGGEKSSDKELAACGMFGNSLPAARPPGVSHYDRTPERIAKAQAFHARLKLARQNPANCCRCGKPRDGQMKQCSKCRAYQAKYRGKLVDKDAKLTGSVVVAMVKQMRREMDKMQIRFRLWQRAADYRRNLNYRTNTMRKKYYKAVSHAEAMDYLTKTNHAFERNEQ
jgi:hypothetical protein